MPRQPAPFAHLTHNEQLEAQDFATPLVIVHPRHPHRRALQSYLLHNFAGNIYYFALTTQMWTTREFLHEFAQSLQFPENFTRTIHHALGNTDDPKVWAEHVGAALHTLEKSAYMLVLDDLDIIQFAPDFPDFFVALANHLPAQVQVLVNGRDLLRQPWVDQIEQGLASVIGQHGPLGDRRLFQTDSQTGVIEFYALQGQTRVVSDGFQVHTWDGALPRNLCYYFIEHERVTRQQLFDIFWPHLGIKEATNVFHVTKHKISEKLGYDITDYSGGFYIPAQNVKVYYDARELEQTYHAALQAPRLTTIDKWMRIVELYYRPYLLEVDMPWAENKRSQLRDYYIHALVELAQHHAGQQDHKIALNYYLRAGAEHPTREDIHRHMMQVYQELGDREAIVKQYKLLEKALRTSLHIKPSQATQDLYTTLTGKRP